MQCSSMGLLEMDLLLIKIIHCNMKKEQFNATQKDLMTRNIWHFLEVHLIVKIIRLIYIIYMIGD